MQTVQSEDATTIAYETVGSGPPLVLVVGAFCDHASTAPLADALSGAHTVVAYDRRGRGSSGDAGEYSIEREVADLRAVVAAVGEPVGLYGHSSGGALALEAAAAGLPVTRLAVYEPPYTAAADGTGGSDELLRSVLASLAAGDPGGAVSAFLQGSGAPEHVVQGMRAGPGWPHLLAFAPTLAYDLALTRGGTAPAERLARIDVPTIALAGGASPPWAASAGTAILAAVPGARLVTVPGQGHGVDQSVLAPFLAEFFAAG